MVSEPRRIWGGVLVPADLYSSLTAIVGPRGLNAAVNGGLLRLIAGECGCDAPRPARERGSVTITVRVPVPLADAADEWRSSRAMSRQALVEYALMATLDHRSRGRRRQRSAASRAAQAAGQRPVAGLGAARVEASR